MGKMGCTSKTLPASEPWRRRSRKPFVCRPIWWRRKRVDDLQQVANTHATETFHAGCAEKDVLQARLAKVEQALMTMDQAIPSLDGRGNNPQLDQHALRAKLAEMIEANTAMIDGPSFLFYSRGSASSEPEDEGGRKRESELLSSDNERDSPLQTAQKDALAGMKKGIKHTRRLQARVASGDRPTRQTAPQQRELALIKGNMKKFEISLPELIRLKTRW
ncbi:hypothetical protein TI39_contig1053g00004 [Zymoseptoria brevis]|uniref:Uncharacterized protein n=1 Tax=Zymoseptoria brevis TaxID=1047168 RepID=A0A0F4GFI2_9PEZI|nr:hypothetical protein TI39_contig1053g00004 [Zymoseptoria brevis]